MQYISTRGGGTPKTFLQALLEGLADDGGLLVPERMPELSHHTLESWRGLSYPALAAEILGRFATDISPETIRRLADSAYSRESFPELVPLRPLDSRITLVGLSEGPTLAFKDMAMQFLGFALEYALTETDGALNVVGATSGDTGAAAEAALRGKHRVAVFMLSPQGRMSAFQRAQMYSIDDPNIHNVAVEGVFDDSQNLVKALASDIPFKNANHIGAVNSINLARIAAQIVYYIWAWLRASDAVEASARESFEVDVTVPSGNFGNILSGFYARSMGLPVRTLVLATNENNVLDDFFRTGIYQPRNAERTLATSSPSMDVSKASNLERFIYEVLGRDTARVAAAFEELRTTGMIDLTAEQPRFRSEFGIVSGTSTHADRLDTIRETYDAGAGVIDPHTADGVKVAREYLEVGVPMLVLETAKPEKFQDTITEALGIRLELSPELEEMLHAPQHVVTMSNDEAALRAYLTENAVN